MTKRWSGTRSDLSLTKRAASKLARRKFSGLLILEDVSIDVNTAEFRVDGRCVGRIVNIGGEVEDGDAG